MPTLQDARARVAAVLDEIDRLKQSEFPYTHPREALELLESRFKWHQSVLGKATDGSQSAVVYNACRDSLRELQVYVPILGFILRATNVRNAFEEYGPLQRLAHRIIGIDVKLIVSSEWEFSPFMYRAITGLSGFVLIGLPAPESSNPLLLPLAGHELGHSIWEYENLGEKYDKKIQEGILDELTGKRWKEYSELYPQYTKEKVKGEDLFAHLTWRPAYTWALLQTEEMFCDFMGLRMFAEAYLYAFAYLLSPGTSGQRSLRYPNIKRRVSHLVDAANQLGLMIPGYEAAFVEGEREPADPTTALLVSIADTVSSSLVQELVDLAVAIAREKEVPSKDPEKVKRIVECIREWVVPVRESASLIDIVNAGWECNRDEDLWKNVPQIKRSKENEFAKNRDRILQDIMLKSMEISEIHERLRKPS